ncbi:MAG: ABC transporter permease [Gemmatimonadaceae bacterium]
MDLRLLPRSLRAPAGRIELKLVRRTMARTPLLTATAVLSLAIGITLAATAFGIVRGVMFGQLPVPEGDRIVQLRDIDREHGWDEFVDHAAFVRRRDALQGTIDLAAFATTNVLVEGPGNAGRVVSAATLSANGLGVLRIRPIAGRLFSPDDDQSGRQTTVIGETLAQAMFGGTQAAVGQTLRIDGAVSTVVGVIGSGFQFPYNSEIWTPVAMTSAPAVGPVYRLYGRLSSGTSIESAGAAFTLVGQREAHAAPSEREKLYRVLGFTRFAGKPAVAFGMWLAVGALVMLLLVSAGNVANLLLARSAARGFEFAVRAALGARRARIVGQLVLEAAAIALAAVVLSGVAVGVLLRWFKQAVTDLPYWIDLSVGAKVLLFIAALALVATAVVSLLPARQVVRLSLTDMLKNAAPHIRFGRVGAALIAVQLAIAIGFLGGVSSVGQGLASFGYADIRVAGERTLVAQLYYGQPPELLRSDAPADPDRRRAIWAAFQERTMLASRELVARLGRAPNVEAVALGSLFPGNETEESVIEIEADVTGGVHRTRVVETGAGYFATMSHAIVRGREFTSAELGGQGAVLQVNESFVNRYALGAALGRRVRRVLSDGAAGVRPGPWMEIVGVVPDLALSPGNPAEGDGLYLPLAPTNVLRVAVRARGAAGAVVPLLHAEVQGLDPRPQVQWSKTLDAQLREPVLLFRVTGVALLALGSIAFLLAGAGIYAVLALRVAQGRREIAVRIALGASRWTIARAVLRQNVSQVTVGIAAGSLLAAGVAALIGSLPFDVARDSVAGFVGTAGVLVTIAVAACAVPIHRAIRVHPADLMRDG